MGDEQTAEPARLRAAAYARQPSVWPAPTPTPPRPDRTRRLGQLVRAGVTAGVLIAGPPVLLWQVSGNPITELSSWWTTTAFITDSPAPPVTGLRVALIWAGWLGWAVVATLLTGSLAGVLRGRRLPRWRLPMPLHRLVFGLAGSATVALVATPATAAMASPAAQIAPATQPQTTVLDQAKRDITTIRYDLNPAETRSADASSGLATITAADTRYEHPVRKGRHPVEGRGPLAEGPRPVARDLPAQQTPPLRPRRNPHRLRPDLPRLGTAPARRRHTATRREANPASAHIC